METADNIEQLPTNETTAPEAPPKLVIQRDFYALISANMGKKVLLLPGAQGWQLPYWQGDKARHPQEITTWVCEQVKQLTGLETRLLVTYYARRDFNEQAQFAGMTRILAFELDNPAMAVLPDGAVWAGLAEVSDLQFENQICRQQVVEWLTEHTGGQIPARRVGWARPGWFAATEKWLADVAKAQGWQLGGKIEQLKANCISTILRLPTTQGTLYLKGTPHYFGSEPNFSRVLTDLLPGKTPHLLATDVERGLILSADFGGTPVDKIKDLNVWKEALAEYARLQIACIPHAEKLLAAGVRDRRLVVLGEQIEKMLARREFMRVGLPFGLSAEAADKVQSLAPRIKALCEELAALGIPETIDSGDFHAYNVNQTANGFIFYDWSDLEITQPFASIFTFLEFAWDYKEEIPDFREQLRDAYLAPWQALYPQVDLVRAFNLAFTLGALVQNLNYEWIWDNVEPREHWEFEYVIGEFYTTFLQELEKLEKTEPAKE